MVSLDLRKNRFERISDLIGEGVVQSIRQQNYIWFSQFRAGLKLLYKQQTIHHRCRQRSRRLTSHGTDIQCHSRHWWDRRPSKHAACRPHGACRGCLGVGLGRRSSELVNYAGNLLSVSRGLQRVYHQAKVAKGQYSRLITRGIFTPLTPSESGAQQQSLFLLQSPPMHSPKKA